MVDFLRHSNLSGKKEAEEILEKARQEARTILHDATEQADKIIREAHLFTRRIQTEVADNLKQSGDSIVTESNITLNQFLSTAQDTLRNFLKKAEQELGDSISHFSQEFEKRLGNLEETMIEEMKKEYKKLMEVAAAEKKQSLAKAEEAIQKQLPALIREVIGVAIPLEGHEDIVRHRLEDIKNSPVW